MKNNFYKGDVEEIVKKLSDIQPSFEGKRVLITGGTGFLGKYFIQTFIEMNKSLKNPVKIIALDNFISSSKSEFKIQDSNLEMKEYNVIEAINIDQKVDYILHAAGIASPQYYRKYPLETLDVAIMGTRNILNLAKKHNARMLFFSSSEIYGDPDSKYVPTDEEYRGNVSCLGPRACYDESKRLGETLCRIYAETHGVGVAMVRPFNVYGPGMSQSDYRVLPNFASKIICNQPIAIYGTGKQTRTFCYITDAINGFVRTLVKGKPGEPYNVGNPTPEVSMLDLMNSIEKVLDKKVKMELREYPESYPADEPMRRCPNIQKAKSHLNYLPTVSLDEGLTRFFKWAADNYITT